MTKIPSGCQNKTKIENPVGSFTVGIDDGAKEVGLAVVNVLCVGLIQDDSETQLRIDEHKAQNNEKTKEVVFRGTIQLRQDVSKKIKQRAQYRRTRRTRKVRHRKARFLNRKQIQPQPSIRQRKECLVFLTRTFGISVKKTKRIYLTSGERSKENYKHKRCCN